MDHLQLQVSAGTLGVTWNSKGKIVSLEWLDNCLLKPRDNESVLMHASMPKKLREYTLGLLRYMQFGEPLELAPWDMIDHSQWSEFQAVVYKIISTVPHGETRTYAWVAQRVGLKMQKQPSPRAVGQALKKNPFPIIIPCHRIVGVSALGGYMGSVAPEDVHIRLKQWLIDLESHYRNPCFAFLSGFQERSFRTFENRGRSVG